MTRRQRLGVTGVGARDLAVTDEQESRVAAVQQDIGAPATAPFPPSLRRRLDKLVDGVIGQLDDPMLRAPDNSPTLRPFQDATAKMASGLFEMATLSPAPSVFVTEALLRVSKKAFKRSDRCRPRSSIDRVLRGTAQGYFAILGELASALAYAQGRNSDVRPAQAERALDELSERARELVSSGSEAAGAYTAEWPASIDRIVRDVASMVTSKSDRSLEALHLEFKRRLEAGWAKDAISASAAGSTEVARLGSCLDALRVVLAVASRFEARSNRSGSKAS